MDYSLHRLRHYTGTAPEHFQNFVLFTNYQFYIDEFIRLGRQLMQSPDSDYIAFVEPGNVVTPGRPGGPGQRLAPPRLPQMPAYHLVREDGCGITMVNIGVGPSNAKTATDHIAVLRPHAWLMLGHCAGLRNTQQLGDYVLAHGYVREDHVLDEELPLWVPIPALAEVQLALEQAVAEITQLSGYELKKVLRTGTVATTDNRNWELLPHPGPERRFSQSRAVALDMESATIAANGFRFRVPYGTLLCVSDKPLHGEIKLPGMANHFYRERVDQHLRIGIRALELLRAGGSGPCTAASCAASPRWPSSRPSGPLPPDRRCRMPGAFYCEPFSFALIFVKRARRSRARHVQAPKQDMPATASRWLRGCRDGSHTTFAHHQACPPTSAAGVWRRPAPPPWPPPPPPPWAPPC
jgi:AMP nucleosidase